MYFKRVFRLFWQLVPPPLAPPSELQGGASAPGPSHVSAPAPTDGIVMQKIGFHTELRPNVKLYLGIG